MNSRITTTFLHSRGAALLFCILAVVATVTAYNLGRVIPITGSRGLALPSANEWMAPGPASLAVNMALNIAIVFLSVTLNKTFNIMRSLTALWGTLFIVMQSAIPIVTGQFYGGTLMCLLMMAVMAIMFTCYGDNSRRRRVFLMFLILSTASFIQYAYMFYIPVLVVGLAQMRVLNLRSLTAAFIGIITPPWIIFGSGMLSIDDLRWPEFVGTLNALDAQGMIRTFAPVGVSIIAGIVFLCGNVMKLLSYNARFRAYNGFLTVVLLATILLILVDYNNLSIYIPLLNLSVAYQISHFFSNRRHPKSYIYILSVIALYILLYLFSIIL